MNRIAAAAPHAPPTRQPGLEFWDGGKSAGGSCSGAQGAGKAFTTALREATHRRRGVLVPTAHGRQT